MHKYSVLKIKWLFISKIQDRFTSIEIRKCVSWAAAGLQLGLPDWAVEIWPNLATLKLTGSKGEDPPIICGNV